MSVRALEASEKRTLAILGLPTAALALAITVVTTYVPVAASEFLDSSVVIGGLIAIEGVLALWLPLVVGSWSDRLRTSIGGRLPFLVAATPVAAREPRGTGVVETLPLMVLTVTVFFVAYFIAYEPYRALYPDLIDDAIAARAQSRRRSSAASAPAPRSSAAACSSRGGPRRPSSWRARSSSAVAMGGFLWVALPRPAGAARTRASSDTESVMEEAFSLGSVVRGHPEMRAYLVANALGGVARRAEDVRLPLHHRRPGPQPGRRRPASSAASRCSSSRRRCVSGKLADRYGRLRAMVWVLPLYGFGQLVPAFTDSIAILVPIMVIVGFGGGLVMTLPYALLQPLMPHGRHGTLTGFYSLSRGIGTAIGPLLAGVAIEVLDGPFGSTRGLRGDVARLRRHDPAQHPLPHAPAAPRGAHHRSGHRAAPRGGGGRLAGHAQDELRRLQRHVELRAVTDPVQLDPVGVRQPVAAEPRGGRRPGQQPVGLSPTPARTGQSMRAASSVQSSRARGRAVARAPGAGRHAEHEGGR